LCKGLTSDYDKVTITIDGEKLDGIQPGDDPAVAEA
jgi:hypothetical protein